MHRPVTIVTAAIIRDQGSVLLTRRPDDSRHAGKWEFPGGKLEDGEAPVDCLRREIQEELGLAIRVDRVYDIIYHHYDFGPILLLTYECTPLSDTIQNLQVAEHRFVPYDQLHQYDVLPADVPLVERLIAESGS